MINILIADDHQVFREGIASILEDVADIQVIAQAANGRETLQKLQEVQPDVILMDISMEDVNGIETTKKISRQFPLVRILALSMHDESDYIISMLEAGAGGYLLKDCGSTEMIKAIREIAAGNNYYSQRVSAVIVRHLTHGKKMRGHTAGIPLTPRELEVLELIVKEYSNPEIAERLYISIRTVDTHRRNLIEKLGVKNTAGMVKYAIKHGLVD